MLNFSRCNCLLRDPALVSYVTNTCTGVRTSHRCGRIAVPRQLAPSAAEYLPTPQSIQLLKLVAASAEDVPPAQLMHVPEPVVSLYFPDTHAVQFAPVFHNGNCRYGIFYSRKEAKTKIETPPTTVMELFIPRNMSKRSRKHGSRFWVSTQSFGQSKEGKRKNLLDERMVKRRGEDKGVPAPYSRRPGF